jgi:hypothetical protein
VVFSGEINGFLSISFQDRQQKGMLIKPIVKEGYLDSVPSMLYIAGGWLEKSGRQTMIVEIPDQWIKIRDYLFYNGWKRQFSWLELVRWLN